MFDNKITLNGLCSFMVLAFFAASLNAAPPRNSIADDYAMPGNVGREASRATFGRALADEGVASDIDYHVIEVQKHSPGNAALRSALLPGWGQRFNGQKV